MSDESGKLNVLFAVDCDLIYVVVPAVALAVSNVIFLVVSPVSAKNTLPLYPPNSVLLVRV